MWSKFLLILGVITVLVVPVNAKSVSLGPQVGYYKVQDADQGDFMGGVAWRFRLTPMLGLEASINYRQEKYADDVLTVRSWPIMVTGLIYPFPEFMEPLALVGIARLSIMIRTSSRYLKTKRRWNLAGILAVAWNYLSVQISN